MCHTILRSILHTRVISISYSFKNRIFFMIFPPGNLYHIPVFSPFRHSQPRTHDLECLPTLEKRMVSAFFKLYLNSYPIIDKFVFLVEIALISRSESFKMHHLTVSTPALACKHPSIPPKHPISLVETST